MPRRGNVQDGEYLEGKRAEGEHPGSKVLHPFGVMVISYMHFSLKR